MKFFILFFSLFWISHLSGSHEIESAISPPMELTKNIPVEMTYKNKERYLYSSEIEQKNQYSIKSTLQAKSFPWIFLLASSVITGCIFIIRNTPLPKKEILSTSTITPEDSALNELNQLNIKNEAFTSTLDNILRGLIAQKYGISAPTLTTQECLNQIRLNEHIDLTTKQELAHLFLNNESAKFMGKDMSLQQRKIALDSAKHIIMDLIGPAAPKRL